VQSIESVLLSTFSKACVVIVICLRHSKENDWYAVNKNADDRVCTEPSMPTILIFRTSAMLMIGMHKPEYILSTAGPVPNCCVVVKMFRNGYIQFDRITVAVT